MANSPLPRTPLPMQEFTDIVPRTSVLPATSKSRMVDSSGGTTGFDVFREASGSNSRFRPPRIWLSLTVIRARPLPTSLPGQFLHHLTVPVSLANYLRNPRSEEHTSELQS